MLHGSLWRKCSTEIVFLEVFDYYDRMKSGKRIYPHTTSLKKNGVRVYMDYASATPVDPRVKEHMRSIEDKLAGNPDALHEEGRFGKKILEDARKVVATTLRAHSDEIIFTSGATESNNLAILGVHSKLLPIFQKRNKTPHIIVSTIEHKSVLETAERLRALGADVSYIRPNPEGIISPRDIRDAIKPETILVSIMYANNEIGAIQLIAEIAKVIRNFRKSHYSLHTTHYFPLFHTDATQAVNYCDMNIAKLGVDLLTMNSPKVYGPAGIGALFIKRATPIMPIIFGGGQEGGLRSGRELPLLATGFAKALEIAEKEKIKEAKRLAKLRNYFFEKIFLIIPKAKPLESPRFRLGDASINGDMQNRLPNNVNICVPNLDAEFAVYQLDEKGIACSSASTCVSASEDSYSYVIEETRPGSNCASSSLRFSLGRYTSKRDVDYCLKALKEVVSRQYSVHNNNFSSVY